MKLRALLTALLINTCMLSAVWGSSDEDEGSTSHNSWAHPSFIASSSQPTDEPQASSSAAPTTASYSLAMLPEDIIVYIFPYLSTADSSRLWETGDKRMQIHLRRNITIFDMMEGHDYPYVSDPNKLKPTKLVPSYIALFQKLRVLNLYENGLDTLPLSFSQLTDLEVLNIAGNLFSGGTLPAAILALPRLGELHIRDCGLTHLPENFSHLSKLVNLNVSYNSFEAGVFPEELSSLTGLKTLEIGSYDSFKRHELPESSTNLSNLTNLTINARYFNTNSLLPLIRIGSLEVIANPVGQTFTMSLSPEMEFYRYLFKEFDFPGTDSF